MAHTLNRWGRKLNHVSMTNILSNNCAKNYLNEPTTVKIIVESWSWMVHFFCHTVWYFNSMNGCSSGHWTYQSRICSSVCRRAPVTASTFAVIWIYRSCHPSQQRMHSYTMALGRPGRHSRSRKSSAEKRLSRSRAEFWLSRSRKMFEPAEPSRKNFDVIIFNCIFAQLLMDFYGT